jgi:hypothetical protein
MWHLFSETGLNPVLKDAVDIISKLVETLAILAAGLFAYFKFFKERVYRPRLEPRVSARLVVESQRQFLKIIASVKNTGLAKVDIALEPSCLQIFGAASLPSTMADEPTWNSVAILDIADRHEWIEAEEILRQTWLVAIPESCTYPAYRVEFRLVGRASEWYAEAVVVSPLGSTSLNGTGTIGGGAK